MNDEKILWKVWEEQRAPQQRSKDCIRWRKPLPPRAVQFADSVTTESVLAHMSCAKFKEVRESWAIVHRELIMPAVCVQRVVFAPFYESRLLNAIGEEDKPMVYIGVQTLLNEDVCAVRKVELWTQEEWEMLTASFYVALHEVSKNGYNQERDQRLVDNIHNLVREASK